MNPSASSILRAERCPASHALPQVNSTSPDAERGTIGHAYLYSVLKGTNGSFPEWCGDIETIDLPWVGSPEQWTGEAAYVLDSKSGRVRFLGENIGRKYPDRDSPDEIFLTIDLAGPGRICDYKFHGFESHTMPADKNPQLAAAAYCVARIQGVNEITASLLHIGSDGHVREESAVLDYFDLDSFLVGLRSTITRVRQAEAEIAAGRTPEVTRGEWCRYCHAASCCPSVTALVRAIASAPIAQTADEVYAMLTPQLAGKAYRRLREVQDVLKQVASALHMYADEFPIDLGDGTVYGPVTSDRESIDARVARKVLADKFGPETAEAACDFETSKAAITRALQGVQRAKKEVGEKVTLRSIQEETLDAIRASGGIEMKQSRRVIEHKKDKS